MIQYDRQQNILSLLSRKGSATIKEIAEEVFASEASVRRDISRLESEGLVRKVYGGVILSDYKNSAVPLALRQSDNSRSKETIASRAASRVKNGSILILDASSTVARMIKYLGGARDLRIITNSLSVLDEISKLGNPEIRAYCTGGELDVSEKAFFGPSSENYLASVSADAVFFSSQGISEDGEISDASERETSLRRVMLSRAREKIFLCDSSKVGARKMFTLCHRESISEIICDAPLPWDKEETKNHK